MLSRITRRSFANSYPKAKVNGIADFRSDTVTKPCPKMRDAMANAICGDEIFNDDPTTIRLQQQMAELLGKEDALLTTSGV